MGDEADAASEEAEIREGMQDRIDPVRTRGKNFPRKETQTMAVTKKAPGGLLGQLARKAPVAETAKGDTPVVELPNIPETKQALEKLVGAKKQKSQAEATIEQQEELLIPTCSAARKTHLQETQKFASTVRIKLEDDETLPPVNFGVASKYSAIPVTVQEKLQERFGDEYDKCFDLMTEIEATPAGMKKIEKEADQPDGLLAKIIAACGGLENFEKFFTVKQNLKVTEHLHQQGVLDSKLAKIHEKCIEDQLYKPQKPSFRTF